MTGMSDLSKRHLGLFSGRPNPTKRARSEKDPEPETDENKVVTALYQRWLRPSIDSNGKRLVMKIIALHAQKNALVNAILIDDVKLFTEAAVKPHPFRLLSLFEFACLCAAKNIVFELADKINVLKSTYAVAYALSTGNREFAVAVAMMMKNKGQEDEPQGIHFYNECTYSTVETIAQLFATDENTERVAPKG